MCHVSSQILPGVYSFAGRLIPWLIGRPCFLCRAAFPGQECLQLRHRTLPLFVPCPRPNHMQSSEPLPPVNCFHPGKRKVPTGLNCIRLKTFPLRYSLCFSSFVSFLLTDITGERPAKDSPVGSRIRSHYRASLTMGQCLHRPSVESAVYRRPERTGQCHPHS